MVSALLGVALIAVVAITFAFRAIGAFAGAFLAILAVFAHFGCTSVLALMLLLASLSFVASLCFITNLSFFATGFFLAFLFLAFFFCTLSLGHGSSVETEGDDGRHHQEHYFLHRMVIIN